jgi:hypothetical protein
MKAVKEFDEIGRDAFLKKYGFGPSRDYFLVVDGREYDSKAIVGAAHGFEFPDQGPLDRATFSGGKNAAAKKLGELGFEIAPGGGGRLHKLLEDCTRAGRPNVAPMARRRVRRDRLDRTR